MRQATGVRSGPCREVEENSGKWMGKGERGKAEGEKWKMKGRKGSE
jgi:hypothetical protein